MVLLVLTLGVADVLMLGVVDGMCGELAFKNMYLYKLTESQTAWINGLLKKRVTAMWTKDEKRWNAPLEMKSVIRPAV